MTEAEEKFIREVRVRCADPRMLRLVIGAAIGGCEDAAFTTMQRAADMEVVAAMALNGRVFKDNKNFLAQKLEKWNGQTSLRWDDQIKALKEKAK
jgi:hypothetical protein